MRVYVNGVPLYVAVRGQGPALTLIHGFPLSHRIYDTQFRALSHHYRVITPDLRGFCKSALGTDEVTMDTYADDIAAILDELGIEKTVLGGLSMGGYIAFAFWRRHPQRVQALILMNTRAAPDSEEGRQNRYRLIEQVRREGLTPLIESIIPKLVAPATLKGKPHVLRKLRHIMEGATVEGVIAALKAMAERPDSRPTLETITVPTLVIAGQADALIPVSEAEDMAMRIPDAYLYIVPQAGHLVTMERPRLTSRLIRNFMMDVLRA